MYGLGTLINVLAIIIGGLLGLLFAKLIKDNHRDTLSKACGLSVIFIGAAGTFKGMFSVENGLLSLLIIYSKKNSKKFFFSSRAYARKNDYIFSR